MTISDAKSTIGVSKIIIVDIVCDYNGHHPEKKKIQKILDWPVSRCMKGARGFIEIIVYYHIFITEFVIIAALIFILFQKDTKFV